MPNKRKCKHCGEYVSEFIVLPVGAFCNKDHAILYARDKKRLERVKKRKTREKKVAIDKQCKKTQKAKAQAVFNAYIRERDRDLPCISCGRYHKGQYHAGHYKTRGAHPELAFHPLNCHKQCSACNNYLSGNIVNYRKNLIEKIGLDSVEWLEGSHKVAKLTAEDYIEIASWYKELIKSMEVSQ